MKCFSSFGVKSTIYSELKTEVMISRQGKRGRLTLDEFLLRHLDKALYILCGRSLSTVYLYHTLVLTSCTLHRIPSVWIGMRKD